MKKRNDLIINSLLLLIDQIALITGLVISYFIRIESGRPKAYPVSGYYFLTIILILIPVWVGIFFVNGMYSRTTNRFFNLSLIRIISGVSSVIMFLILINFISFNPIIPARLIPIYGLFVCSLLIFIIRWLFSNFLKILMKRKKLLTRVILIGNNPFADSLEKTCQDYSLGIEIVDVLNISDYEDRIDKLESIFKKEYIDRVILTATEVSSNDLTKLIDLCNELNIEFGYIPTASGIYKSKVQTIAIGDLPVLLVQSTALTGWGRIFKRLFDIFFSLLTLIILSPLFIILIICQKIFNPGKVFYKHYRLGFHGETIKIYKFRSMKEQYCTGPEYSNRSNLDTLKKAGSNDKEIKKFNTDFKLSNDPRVTKFGRILRRFTIDELPQLLNVLRGELSFVGPRPITKEELYFYGNDRAILHHIKPGLTGLWQANGGNTLDYKSRVRLDIYYIRNWSISMDLKIIFKTVLRVLRGHGI